MTTALDRAQIAYDNLSPEDYEPDNECPQCGAALEYDSPYSEPFCPVAHAWRMHEDEPTEYDKPDDEYCDWVCPDCNGPDPDQQRDEERDRKWDEK